MHQVG